MNESNLNNEKPQKERRYDPELLERGLRCDLDQYEMLKRCSYNEDLTEWNNWRSDNSKEEIWLQGADLDGAHLEGALLDYGHLEGADLRNVHLEDSNLFGAHFEGADLEYAHLKGASPLEAHLEGANLLKAHLEEVNLEYARLERADIRGSHLEGAWLTKAYLDGADLRGAYLEGAHLCYAHLEGTNLYHVHLEGADFKASVVDGSTLFWECYVSRKTDFRSVGLDTCLMEEKSKYLLEYNKRRMNWEDWYIGESDKMRWDDCSLSYSGTDNSEKKRQYKMRQLLTYPVYLFWLLSDYGQSTLRIIFTFFGLAFTFALLYRLFPNFVMVYGEVGDIRGFWHALYFSVVTMTTLGFGDIAASPDSWVGQTLLMVQVILGYVLLGALVTRFAVLFTAGGPAGKFADEKEKKEDKKK